METGTRTMPDGTVLFTREWSHDDPVASMLMIHGVSEHSGRWEHVAAFFVDRGFEVFSYDQRSHGESGDGVIDIADFDLFIDDIAHTISQIRTEGRPLVLYGHSMGGLIATLYAESDHEQPDLLVLSAPPISAERCVPAPLRIAAKVFGRLVPRLALTSPIEESHLSRDPAVGQAYVSDPNVYLKGSTRFGRHFFAAMDRGGENIHRIRVPTLVIHGGDDQTVPTETSTPLAAVPDVERRVFPGLRHELHNEPESAEVLGVVVGWIKERLGV